MKIIRHLFVLILCIVVSAFIGYRIGVKNRLIPLLRNPMVSLQVMDARADGLAYVWAMDAYGNVYCRIARYAPNIDDINSLLKDDRYDDRRDMYKPLMNMHGHSAKYPWGFGDCRKHY